MGIGPQISYLTIGAIIKSECHRLKLSLSLSQKKKKKNHYRIDVIGYNSIVSIYKKIR